MLSISRFQKLKLEVAAYECTCFEDLRIFTCQTTHDIRRLTEESYEVENEFFRNYINNVILPSLKAIEQFLIKSEIYEEKIEFKVRSLKYHFNFIIDCCIYAKMINYR
jgi:hypothetical protein